MFLENTEINEELRMKNVESALAEWRRASVVGVGIEKLSPTPRLPTTLRFAGIHPSQEGNFSNIVVIARSVSDAAISLVFNLSR